jgi:uncharacterized damage-inducible protein DinB
VSPERSTQIEAIESLPAKLEAAVAGLSPAQLETPYRSGGWTVRQVVHHLADSHMNAFIRMKLILTEDRPRLKAYDQERWARSADVSEVPSEASLALLRGLHQRWVALLRQIPEEAWSRAADHPESGEVTLESLLAVYAHHGENHVGQILQLRASRAW